MDDMLNYLMEKEFFASMDDLSSLAVGKLATEGYKFNGAEVYWWDLENLEEGSDEEVAYQSMTAEGIIDVYGMGVIMAITPNGPFGLSLTYYDGDADALMEAFQTFGRG